MKMRRIAALLLCAALFLGMVPAASAAESGRAAETLYELGLFQGVGKDDAGKPLFDLERTPTRAEALVMLVRLLGKESEAKAWPWKHPFTDVEPWAEPYVAYAYENGLANGTTATTFGGSAPADGNTYLTFVLRALGYQDKAGATAPDFTYSGAVAFAKSVGLTEQSYGEGFSRGDVAVVSLAALTQSVKGENVTLMDRLAREGAVSRAVAEEKGLLAAVAYDGTKLLAPCAYDEKGACELTPATILSLLPDCRYVLSYFGWSEKSLTMREHFLIGLGGALYGADGPQVFNMDSFSMVIPKHSKDAGTYTFFVDESYRVLAYLDSTMLTPGKSTVPLETKVSIDGGAIYKEVTATMAEKLGRAGEERFTIGETPYKGVQEFQTPGGRVEVFHDTEAALYPILGEDAQKAAYVTYGFIPDTETGEMIGSRAEVGVFNTLFLHPEYLISSCEIDDPASPLPFGFRVDMELESPGSIMMVTIYDKNKVCLGYALRR